MMMQSDLPKARERMVREEVEKKGVTDPRVLAAMLKRQAAPPGRAEPMPR